MFFDLQGETEVLEIVLHEIAVNLFDCWIEIAHILSKACKHAAKGCLGDA